MIRCCRLIALFAVLTMMVPQAVAQESQAAKSTREKLKQVIEEIDVKEAGTKAFFDEINGEIKKPINFKIDNASGVSNNSKLSFKAKKITVEKLLNDLSDKYEFGWVVISNVGNNKIDGWVIIRRSTKGKERGYEAGTEPKSEKGSSLELPRLRGVAAVTRETTPSLEAVVTAMNDLRR